MRCNRLFGQLGVFVLILGLATDRAEGMGLTRWGDFGLEIGGGSFQIGLQKRFSQAGLGQWECSLCAHYGEIWFELDEADDGPADVDVETLGLGWRYYLFTGDRDPRRRERLAMFVRLGLTRVELDPGDTHSGYYGGLGFEYPITQSYYTDGERKGQIRPFWVSALATVTQNEIDRGQADLDYLSTKLGVRFIFPSARDRRRSECLRKRVHVIETDLDARMLAGVIEGARAEAVDQAMADLDVFDRMERYAEEIEMLFDRGELAEPRECSEGSGPGRSADRPEQSLVE